MLEARLHKALDLRVGECAVPEPQAGEALLAVKAVGVCGSDVHNYAEGGIGGKDITAPLRLGHEFAAQVVGVGAGVSNVKPGDRVAVDPGISCGVCEVCQHGHPNLCPTIRYCGTPPDEGCLCEFMTFPAANLHQLPDNMSYAAGSVMEPLGIALHAVNLAKLKLGDTVAVLGAGPIGLLITQLVRLSGAQDIYVTDLLPYRLEAAKRFGAAATLDASQGSPVREILRLTGGRGVDVAIEAAGAAETPQQAAEVARYGGRLVLAGIPVDDSITMRASTLRRKGLTIRMVRRMQHTYPRAITMVSRGIIDVDSIITHRFPITQSPEAFDLVHHYRDGVIKAVIEM